jgi:hypothetical protein
MGFFSFLKYTFIIFAAQLATFCGAPFENHWKFGNVLLKYLICNTVQWTLDQDQPWRLRQKYYRNVGNTIHIHTAPILKKRISINVIYCCSILNKSKKFCRTKGMKSTRRVGRKSPQLSSIQTTCVSWFSSERPLQCDRRAWLFRMTVRRDSDYLQHQRSSRWRRSCFL